MESLDMVEIRVQLYYELGVEFMNSKIEQGMAVM